MSNIEVFQKPSFKKVYKKLHGNLRNKVDNAIDKIIENPKIGKPKKGDLLGLYVYKFKAINQEYLLAYTWDEKSRHLIYLDMHENFYQDIKS